MNISNLKSVDISSLKVNKKDSNVMSLENLVVLTIRNLAIENNQSDTEFLNGHTPKEIIKNIESYARSQEDINTVIELTINHASDIIKKYAAQGKSISFIDLMDLTKKYPDKEITSLVSYLLAKKDPQLANFAHTLLGSEKVLDNPHISYNPLTLSKQIVYVNKEALQAEEIYSRTNAEDKEVMAYREKKQEELVKDIKKLNYIRLKNLEIEVKNNPEKIAELQKARYQTNFIVRT